MLRGKDLLTPIQRSLIAECAALPDQARFYLEPQFQELALQLTAEVTGSLNARILRRSAHGAIVRFLRGSPLPRGCWPRWDQAGRTAQAHG
jgi:hypothetical protein